MLGGQTIVTIRISARYALAYGALKRIALEVTRRWPAESANTPSVSKAAALCGIIRYDRSGRLTLVSAI